MGAIVKLDAALMDRFSAKVAPEPNTGCWLWCGSPNSSGYGELKVCGRMLKAHRVSYELHIGEIPQGLHVCHHCDTPLCVNPSHLFVGTNADNVRDRMAKGRGGCAHGAANGAHTHPERVPRGAAHYAHMKPARRRCGTANGRAKLTLKDVEQLRARRAEGVPYRKLGREFGISGAQAHLIVTGKSWCL